MKKTVFYLVIIHFYLLEACQSSNEKPQIGDAAFYKFTIYQGDSLVYEAHQMEADTAMILIEKANNKTDISNVLMANLSKLGVNDSISFDLPNNQKGFLKLYRIIKAQDFPKYIAESDKRQKQFEKKLIEIRTELKDVLPSYNKRASGVKDSTILLAQQYTEGQLKGQLKTLPSGVEYLVVKGKGEISSARQKWAWFHYCGVLTNGTLLGNSYNDLPAMTNLSEYKLLKSLEMSAASFKDGNTILFIIPPQLAYGDRQVGSAPPNSTLIFWVEVIKNVEM